MVPTNKCLARSNKTRTGAEAKKADGSAVQFLWHRQFGETRCGVNAAGLHHPLAARYLGKRAGMRTIVRASIVALSLACSASAFAEPGCVIKGKISSSGERIYHVPGQRYYDKTLINEHQGERWLCTEQEAIAAGWRKAKV